MVLAIRERAEKVSLLLAVVVAITLVFILVEPTNGQPNYYFKASAPAVKSLPRIGRRSEDGGGSLDAPSGLLEMWPSSGVNSGGGGSMFQLDSFGGSSSSSRSAPSFITPVPVLNSNPMSKAALWRKLFGESGGNSYDEDIILDNLYRSKS